MWFIPFTLRDLIDILLVAMLMFWAYRSTRGSGVPLLFVGIISTYLVWIIVRALGMELLSLILGHIISVGAIAMIILFQPELRRFIQAISVKKIRIGFLARLLGDEFESANRAILPIIESVATLSRMHRGAIIVLAQTSDLTLITHGGVDIDAKLSSPLLRSIFSEKSPLCEGAVVVSGGRVVAAKCILPVTQSDVSISLGLRNRAAIGLSEISDAIVIVVSSHTGEIALARSGNLTSALSADDLARELVVCFEETTKSSDEEVAQ